VAEALNAPPPTLVHIPADLMRLIAPKRFGISIDIFQYPSIFDNSAAIQDLGFRYTIPWVEGVRRTVAWLDERGKIENSDDDPFDDRVIAAWERLGAAMASELHGVE
jgi:nucleoside-diphosphate-sugar epimerase